ncbi:hypothetical protein C8R47DRAFT_308704 [Mycena vitilis]|nr:hypothetical protein C8R47DRAFT_308704 [Mycena vitilis]
MEEFRPILLGIRSPIIENFAIAGSGEGIVGSRASSTIFSLSCPETTTYSSLASSPSRGSCYRAMGYPCRHWCVQVPNFFSRVPSHLDIPNSSGFFLPSSRMPQCSSISISVRSRPETTVVRRECTPRPSPHFARCPGETLSASMLSAMAGILEFCQCGTCYQTGKDGRELGSGGKCSISTCCLCLPGLIASLLFSSTDPGRPGSAPHFTAYLPHRDHQIWWTHCTSLERGSY